VKVEGNNDNTEDNHDKHRNYILS